MFLYGECSASPLFSGDLNTSFKSRSNAPPHLHPSTWKHLGCVSSTELAPTLRSIRAYASLHRPEKEGQGPRPACVPGLNSGGQSWSSCTARGRRPPLRADPPPAYPLGGLASQDLGSPPVPSTQGLHPASPAACGGGGGWRGRQEGLLGLAPCQVPAPPCQPQIPSFTEPEAAL